MKKFIRLFLLALLFVIPSFASAQWSIDIEPDESTMYNIVYNNFYDGKIYKFVYTSSSEYFVLCSEIGDFVTDGIWTDVTIIFYVGNKEISRTTTKLAVPEHNTSIAITAPNKDEELVKKVMRHLKSKGSVRFKAKIDRNSFDFKVPMNREIKLEDYRPLD